MTVKLVQKVKGGFLIIEAGELKHEKNEDDNIVDIARDMKYDFIADDDPLAKDLKEGITGLPHGY